MSEPTPLSILLSATKFASRKHVAQRRKGIGDVPYINHPLEVAEILATTANVQDVQVLVGAVLHDTIEDTNTTSEEIEREFGAAVLKLVLECTDDISLPSKERKRLQIEHASHKSPGAKLIKLADKISNVVDMGASPPSDWSLQRCTEYLDWTEKVVEGLRGQNQALDDRYDRSLNEAREQLARRK